MVQQVEAIYENGVLRPLQPLQLKESERVHLSVSVEPLDPADDLIDHRMVEYARARVAAMDRVPTIQEVREGLSQIHGSMAECIISERGEY